MRLVPLRRRLLLLAGVAILPLAFMSGIALHALLERQRLQSEQSTIDLARALATAVDTELRLTVSALQAMALSEPLGATKAVDLARAHRFAQGVLASRPEWRAVLLATPSGEVVFNTGIPFGEPLPPITEAGSLIEVVRSRAPVIGSLARGRVGNPGIAVRVPVERDGRLLYVLSAVVRPESITRVINAQHIPRDWVVSVFDSKNLRVARSREHDKYLGTYASPSLQALAATMGQRDEVLGPTSTLEGDRVQTAMSRISSARWTIALGVPATVAGDAMRESALAYGGGILLSLGLGAFAAWFVSRGIVRPVARLRDSALALGRGGAVESARADVAEIEAVSDALLTAAALRTRSEAERELLLDAERRARAAAESAQQRLQVLVGAGSLLSRSLEEATTLAAIASVIVPGIADICRVDLLDGDGALQRKLTHHRDPQRGEVIAQLVRKGVVSPDTPGSFPWAIATGRTYLENFDSPEAMGIADPVFLEFVRTAGVRALCVVPLVARGRTIGALAALQADSGRRFSAEDGALVGELAQRAALALDNVRLFAESSDARQQAEVANRAKDEFLAMLGHELRNPLAPIVASLELMARRDGNAAAHERGIIERQVKHLSRMVDDLLDVSRIASGKVELDDELIDLRDVVTHALELTEPALRGRKSAPEVAAPTGPVHVRGDSLRLAQVVCNLLVNAAKFSAPDKRIRIELRQGGSEAQIVVADEGDGISAQLLPRLFDRFVQGEQALQRSKGGLGLGLAIARNLVELHGGSIRAESAGVGQGSRFTVTLPMARIESSSPPAAEAQIRHTSRPARILVVDDNDDAAQAVATLLEIEGHEVRTAASAEDALRLIEGFLPDAAILDIGLPKMNGYELARALRADPATKPIRLVALTGYGQDSDRQRAMQAGFDELAVKPVDIDRLLGMLNALLEAEAAS